MSGKQPVGFEPINVPEVKAYTTYNGITEYVVDHLVTSSGPVNIEGRHAHLNLTPNQAEVLVRGLAAQLGLLVFDGEPTKHTFVASDGDPGHCAICDEFDSEHEPEGYDPERDDFDDEVDTPEDYEGDRYTRHDFEPRSDDPETCRFCQLGKDWYNHDVDRYLGLSPEQQNEAIEAEVRTRS